MVKTASSVFLYKPCLYSLHCGKIGNKIMSVSVYMYDKGK